MAIRFRASIDVLTADIKAGGFDVISVKRVRESVGSTHNVKLCNGATVCWDKESFAIWAEGPHPAVAEIERYLQKLYERPQVLRRPTVVHTRIARRYRKTRQAIALWLIRSDAFAARVLRAIIARTVWRKSLRESGHA